MNPLDFLHGFDDSDEEPEEGIFFAEEDVEVSLPHPEKVLQAWLSEVCFLEKKALQSITFIFCSDDYLHQLNVDYLDHDTLTDVITFPYHEGDEPIQGDIFISTERIADNARDFEVPFEQELCRVMVHGTLHLCGYTDETPELKQQMREKENQSLELLKRMLP
jgi:probable rRNA maturation factor